MVFDHVEKLKGEYTDKYVVVDEKRPELSRFSGFVGRVKTVNMSGRALVEFLDHYANIGWYDIEIDYLKVVDKPSEPEKKAAKKPAAKGKPAPAKQPASGDKKLSPLELARMQGAAKKDGGAAPAKQAAERPIADVLEAARKPKGSGKATPKPAATGDGSKMSVAEVLAAARSEKGGAPVKTKAVKTKAPAKASPAPTSKSSAPAKPAVKDRSEMGVAEILAACRAEKSGEGATVDASSQATAVAEAPETAAEEVSQPVTEEAIPDVPVAEDSEVERASASESSASGEHVDRSTMSVNDMIAWCRKHDGS